MIWETIIGSSLRSSKSTENPREKNHTPLSEDFKQPRLSQQNSHIPPKQHINTNFWQNKICFILPKVVFFVLLQQKED